MVENYLKAKDWDKIWKDPALRKKVEKGREVAGEITKLVAEHPGLLDYIGDDEIISEDTYKRLKAKLKVAAQV